MSQDLSKESVAAGTTLPVRAVGGRRWRTFLLGAIPFVVVMVIWEILGRLDFEALRFVLPSPEAVAAALYDDFASGTLWKHIAITLEEVFWECSSPSSQRSSSAC